MKTEKDKQKENRIKFFNKTIKGQYEVAEREWKRKEVLRKKRKKNEV